MKKVIKTQSELAKIMVAASFFALGCTAIGGTALAQQPTAAQAPSASSQSMTLRSVSYPVRYSVARVDAPLLTQYTQLRSKHDKAGLLQLARAN